MKWNKYDLHMHGHASITKDNNVKKMSASEFIETLAEKGIDVFSLTDHNAFDHKFYQALHSYIEKNDAPIKCIPGAELDIAIQLEIDGQKQAHYLNFLFYFKEAYPDLEDVINSLYLRPGKPDIKQVIEQFNEMRFHYIIIPEGTGQRGIQDFIKNMSPELARYFRINGIYKIFRGFDKTVKESFEVERWAIDFYKKSQELNRLIGKINEDQETFMKRISDNLLRGTRLVDETEIEFAHKIKQFSSFIARFKFSDWHNKDPYQPKYFNHIYGDKNKPYETLELALIDPESRLVVSKDYIIEKNQAYLKSLSFELNSQKHDLDFTEGLNVIIGERGAGKTLLHSIIEALKKGPQAYGNYMKKFKINHVVGMLNNNQEVTPEHNFGAIEIIDQNTIVDYFESQPDIVKLLEGNFNKLEEIDLSQIDLMISCLKTIAVDIKIDDNLSPIISNIKKTRGYIVTSNAEFKDYSIIDRKYKAVNASNIDFLQTAQSLGYEVKHIREKIDDFNQEIKCIVENARLIESFIHEAKSLLDNYIKIRTDELNRSQSSYQQLSKYVERADAYLTSHLNHLMFQFALENFKLKIPKAIVNYHDLGYLFSNRSKLKDSEQIKDQIKATIVSCIFHGDHSNFDTQLQKVIQGENRYNKDKTPHQELQKLRNSFDITTELKVYKTKDKLNLTGTRIDENKLEELTSANKIESVTDGSLGTKTAAYLDFVFETPNSIILIDQPENNIDNKYIANSLVEIIKRKKKTKQLIFVTHNPSLAVYADAFNYILSTNDGKTIEYRTLQITSLDDKNEILDILDGGKFSFSNRNNKYGNVIGGIDYED